MAPQSRQLSAADGTTLFVTDYLLPVASARGSVLIMHGLGEHSGRYRHVAEFFNECGLSVRSYDHRGHGRSGGRRGDVIHGDPLVQDAEIVLDDFAAHFTQAPFLFGHSMGGLFAARFALSRLSPLRGLILSSPALGLHLSPLEMKLLALLEVVAPRLGVPNGVRAQWLCHDGKVVAAYKSDPLVHGKISARLLRSMLGAIAYCAQHAGEMQVPTLMLAAGDERVVDVDGARAFYARLPTGTGELHVYDAMYHEIFNEPQAAQVFADLKRWLEAHLK